jgi:hypothetical protein
MTTTVSVGQGSAGVKRTVVLPFETERTGDDRAGSDGDLERLRGDAGRISISVNVTEIGAPQRASTAWSAGSMVCTLGGVVAGWVVNVKLRGDAIAFPA